MRRVVALAVAVTLVALAGVAPARDHVARAPTSGLAKRFPNAVVLRPPPAGTHKVPAGSVRVTPTAILAGSPGQRIDVTLKLSRAVRSGSFGIRLPARWLQPRGRTPYVRSVRLTRAAGQARLRRAGRLR